MPAPEDFRTMIEGHELSLPYSIKTKGGRSYPVTSHANAFVPDAYPDTLVLGVAGRGIILLGFDSIEAVHTEHERAARV
jgi:hypothetical protein